MATERIVENGSGVDFADLEVWTSATTGSSSVLQQLLDRRR
jgi:hypothetical protein